MGALVMWMAAGFAMRWKPALVRAKNTTEILTKNVALYAVSCVMYLVCGYAIMYGGTTFLTGIETVDVAEKLTEFVGREDGFTGGAIYLARLTSSFRSCLWPPPCPSYPALWQSE